MVEQIVSFIFGLPGGRITAAAILIVLSAAAFYALYKIVYMILKKATEKTRTDFDDDLLERMRDPVRVIIIFSAVFTGLSFTYPDISLGGASLLSLFTVAMVATGAFGLDKFLTTFFKWYQKEVAPKTGSTLDDEMIPLISKFARIGVYVFALMMILSNLGIEITPLLAGLGIASLAVALALQDSLGNFFAGVNIAVDRPLRKDDFISTDTGVEGIVQEIGWRSTKLLTAQNNHVIIPNTKLAQSVITNFYKPDETITQIGTICVAYKEDVEHAASAIKAAILIASEKSQHIVKNFEPIVYLNSFGDFSMNFKFIYKVRNYASRLPAADEVNRAIFYEFKKHAIEIPFPTRVVYNYYAQENQKAREAENKEFGTEIEKKEKGRKRRKTR